MKKNLPLIAIILLLIAFPGWAGSGDSLPHGIRNHDIGAARDFTVLDMDGEPFQFSSTRGRWVFLHFWASWCGPCRREMPEIQKLTRLIPPDKLHYVLVNTAEDEDTVFSFLGEVGLDIDSYRDSDGLATELYKPRGLPTTILVDPGGRVRYQAVGGREWTRPEYLGFLRELLATSLQH